MKRIREVIEAIRNDSLYYIFKVRRVKIDSNNAILIWKYQNKYFVGEDNFFKLILGIPSPSLTHHYYINGFNFDYAYTTGKVWWGR